MVAVPIVKSFCGCCDLKVSCVVIASIRLVSAIILFVIIISYLLMFGYIFSEIDKSDMHGKIDHAAYHLADEIYNWFILMIPVVLINIVFSYWFIQSVTTKYTDKMIYYIYMEVVNICMLTLRALRVFNPYYLVGAVFECYFTVCSYSLYKECSANHSNSHGDTENTVIRFRNSQPNHTENMVPGFENNSEPPPRYSSCCEVDVNVRNTEVNPNLSP